jgi:hypothetical protein
MRSGRRWPATGRPPSASRSGALSAHDGGDVAGIAHSPRPAQMRPKRPSVRCCSVASARPLTSRSTQSARPKHARARRGDPQERPGLQRRIEQVEHDVCQVRDELVERVLASDPRGDANYSASTPSSTRARRGQGPRGRGRCSLRGFRWPDCREPFQLRDVSHAPENLFGLVAALRRRQADGEVVQRLD